MATKIICIFCSQCENPIAQYRKQGSGALIRLILDRIQGPTSLVSLKGITNKSKLPPLSCSRCGLLIGVPMNHEGGSLAFRLVKGSFRRRVT